MLSFKKKRKKIQPTGEKIAKIFRVDCLCAAILLLKFSPPLSEKHREGEMEEKNYDLLLVLLYECFIDGRMKMR